MKKIILTILFSISFTALFACTCVTQKLVDAITKSDFIATAKIISIIPDKIDPEIKITTIELIEVYKGERITSLRINTADNSSCQFDLPLQSTWLFFAIKLSDGSFGFGPCSSSEQIDIKLDLEKYPKAESRHNHSIEFKLKVLSFLRNNQINPINKYELYPDTKPLRSPTYIGVNVSDKEFAVYRVTVGTDLTVQNIKPLKDWEDHSLQSKFSAFMKNEMKILGDKKRQQITAPTELILIFFAYQAEDVYPSFISDWSL